MVSTERSRKAKELHDILKEKSYALVIMHRYADIDAMASALAFRYVLKEKLGYKDVTLICPEGLSAIAKSVASKMRVDIECIMRPENIDIQAFDPESTIIVILDAGGESQLDDFKFLITQNFKRILLDHHYGNDLKSKVDLYIIPRGVYSTSEITTISLKKYIDNETVASLLLAGIVFDTSRFKRASRLTLSSATFLTRFVNYNKVLSLLEGKEELSKRIAKLKGAQRAIVENIGDFVFAITYVSSYESDVASSLIYLGADIVVTVSPKDDGTRIIYRVSERVPSILLERIINTIISVLSPISYGGHRRAGVLMIKDRLTKRDMPSFCKRLMNSIKDSIPKNIESKPEDIRKAL